MDLEGYVSEATFKLWAGGDAHVGTDLGAGQPS